MTEQGGTGPGTPHGNPDENWIPEVANEEEEQRTDWAEPHEHEASPDRNWVPDDANDPAQQQQHTDWAEPHEGGDEAS